VTRILDADIPPRVTADGVTVKRGDMIWRVRCYGAPTRSKVTRDTLKVWTWWRLHEEAYIDERKALTAALEAAKRRHDRARRDLRSAQRTIERLSSKLRATKETP